MPHVIPAHLHEFIVTVLGMMGASPAEAQTVAEHMVGANLAGHDSHGVILLPTYVDRIRQGHILPGAPIDVLDETPTTARINGNWGFGQVVSTTAMELAIRKAKAHQVAALTVFQQSHIGRLADYPVMAAREGMLAWMTADSGRTAKTVVPFGGREPRLGTNPLCIAVPSDLPGPIVLDMATSMAAGNKLAVYRSRHQPLPEGWIVDQAGRPSTDPEAYFNGGHLLPLGGTQGHKGYGLGFMVEVLSGILTGLGFGHDPAGKHNDGCWLAVFNVAAFRPLDEFKREMGEFVRWVKSARPVEGVSEVLYPGEVEDRTQQRRAAGIPIEEETWAALEELAATLGARRPAPAS